MITEWLGRFIGYLIVGLMCLAFSYFAMSFILWDMNLANWSEGDRALAGGWTMILAALIFFESRKNASE